jgi:predicted RNA-binding Zn-ribbon protein involved in translation (DUF1610 family)
MRPLPTLPAPAARVASRLGFPRESAAPVGLPCLGHRLGASEAGEGKWRIQCQPEATFRPARTVCTNCGNEIEMSSQTHVPPCPRCGNREWNTVGGRRQRERPVSRPLEISFKKWMVSALPRWGSWGRAGRPPVEWDAPRTPGRQPRSVYLFVPSPREGHRDLGIGDVCPPPRVGQRLPVEKRERNRHDEEQRLIKRAWDRREPYRR